MSYTVADASGPVFVSMLTNMRAWLDKAEAEKDSAVLVEARLVEDMKPLTAQYQFASDSAKNAIARLLGIDPPAMADAEGREVVMKFPNGMGYRWTGADYLRQFALPNFYFHATMAYAILRAQGVSLGKPDYLQHLGPPEQF